MAISKTETKVTPTASTKKDVAASTKTVTETVKTEVAKTEETAKVTATVSAAENTKKAEPIKTAAKKTTAKKQTTKKTTKKVVVNESVVIQFSGKDIETEALVETVKNIWKKDMKKKVGDLKDIKVYVKPEESMAYYVINGDITGSFGL